MRFEQPDCIHLFGGSDTLGALAVAIRDQGGCGVRVHTCPRQEAEVLDADGRTLGDQLRAAGIDYSCVEDINADPALPASVTPRSLGLGIGEAWSFGPALLEAFGPRLLDLMGIPLPRYRGGAHFTWMILNGCRDNACHLQVVNADMVPGCFDSGEIVASMGYRFSPSCRIPAEYFREKVDHEVRFVMGFLDDMAAGRQFTPTRPQEEFSTYFPRLHTLRQGYIDWRWDAEAVDRFICAFDSPYAGASTFVGGERVFLKGSSVETGDGTFHPFMAGLIFRKTSRGLHVCTRSRALVIREARDERGGDMLPRLITGQRLHTPVAILDEVMASDCRYDTRGLTS